MEVLGIIGSVLVLINYTTKDQKKFRIIALAGCSVFVLYGLSISSFSTVLLNICCLGINGFELVKGILRERKIKGAF